MPTTYRTSYRPSLHGFLFDNSFNNLSAGPIQFWGRCNGMAQVSVDYFRAGRRPPPISVVDQGVRPISGVSAALAAPDRVELYCRRHGDRPAVKYFPLNGPPTHWQTILFSEFTGTPSVTAWAPSRKDLVLRGRDGHVWHAWRDDTRWAVESACGLKEWARDDLGGPYESSPAIAAPYAGRVELYARAADGRLDFRYYENHWSEWSSLGHPDGITLSSDPAATSRYGWMNVFARANDETVWLRRWRDGAWQPWSSVETPITDQARRLNDGIYNRLISTTHTPLIAALALGGAIGLAFLGSIKNYITLRPYGNDQLFQWANVDERQKLIRFLGQGLPIPLSLLDSDGGWGHEVVVYGLDTDASAPGGNLPGNKTFIWVYDPNHPACDNAWITLDADARTIVSSTGESWRAAWVRDDYQPAAPPV